MVRGFEIGLEIGLVGLSAVAGLSSSNFDANGFLSGTVFYPMHISLHKIIKLGFSVTL